MCSSESPRLLRCKSRAGEAFPSLPTNVSRLKHNSLSEAKSSYFKHQCLSYDCPSIQHEKEQKIKYKQTHRWFNLEYYKIRGIWCNPLTNIIICAESQVLQFALRSSFHQGRPPPPCAQCTFESITATDKEQHEDSDEEKAHGCCAEAIFSGSTLRADLCSTAMKKSFRRKQKGLNS